MYLPGPLRAAVGFVASAADEAKNLPDRAIELPMLAVSTVLQVSLRAQQRYARLTARGDEVLNRRQTGDDPPEWATFDEPVSVDELRKSASLNGVGPSQTAAQLLEELFGTAEPTSSTELVHESAEDDPPAEFVTPAAGREPAAKRPEKAAKPAAKKKTAKTSPAKKAAAKKAGAKKTTSKKAPAKKPVAAESDAKTVNSPRHTAPSRFDDIGD